MPKIVGQDGTIYDLSPDQAEQYYAIGDFGAKQSFLRQLGGGSSNALDTRASANALGGGAGTGGTAASGSNALAPERAQSGDLRAVAIAAAQQYGVPAEMFVHQITGESGFNPRARNNIGPGHIGIAQFDPATARALGVDPTDPVQSLYGAAKYMADLKTKTGSWTNAMKSYLGATTPGGLQRVLASNPSYAAAYQLASGQSPELSSGVPVVQPDRNELMASATAPQAVITPPPTGNALGIGALSGLGNSPWTRLLLLSSMMQAGQMSPPLVKYDPRVGMTTIEPRPQQQLGSETGQLPSTTRVPLAPGPSVPSPRPAQLPALPPVPQTPSYITRTGMRDYWSLPQALELATGGTNA